MIIQAFTINRGRTCHNFACAVFACSVLCLTVFIISTNMSKDPSDDANSPSHLTSITPERGGSLEELVL